MALNNFYFIQLCSRIYGLGDIEQTNKLKKNKNNKNKNKNNKNKTRSGPRSAARF